MQQRRDADRLDLGRGQAELLRHLDGQRHHLAGVGAGCAVARVLQKEHYQAARIVFRFLAKWIFLDDRVPLRRRANEEHGFEAEAPGRFFFEELLEVFCRAGSVEREISALQERLRVCESELSQ